MGIESERNGKASNVPIISQVKIAEEKSNDNSIIPRTVMVPHEVPVARAMNSEIRKDNVGMADAGTPPVIHLEKRRSAPTASMIEPEAQANVRMMSAGKIRPMP